MKDLIKRALGFMLCLVGIVLPCRPRIVYSEFLGWLFQGLYLAYFSTIKFIIKKLKQKRMLQ